MRKPVLLLLLVVVGSSGSSFAQETPEPGELWETTVQMTMSGAQSFALPAHKGTLCRPAGQWTEPPAPPDSTCTMTDVSRAGATMSWKMKCTKPPATGEGSMTFEGDASYTGEMTVTMAEGTMVMQMSGRRAGQCDAGKQKREMAAMSAQVEQSNVQMAQAMADTCAKAATSGQSYVFLGPNAMCKEPGQLAAFCAALATEAGYRGAKANASMGIDLAKSAEACKVDPQRIHDELCVQALAGESLDFLVQECPEQAQVIAQRECAGRKYTELAGSEYQGFCGQYAQAELEKQEAEKAAADADPKKKTMDKAKKGLRGLFGK